MIERYHESREQQMDKKIQSFAYFQHENQPFPRSASWSTEHMFKKEGPEQSSIQLRAYHLYREKGGTAFDNWLEAERLLRNRHHQ